MDALYARFDERVGICSDSRYLEAGQIFFALKGERFDGHDFVSHALGHGASAVVIEKIPKGLDPQDKRIFHVRNVLETLQNLARYHRRQWGKPVIALTGSNGKTTVKELFAAVLGNTMPIHATKGNFNNQLGVPITLLQIQRKHELAIVEMGANHQGEIHELCQIAEPSLGYITNFGRAHLEGFGGIEGVIKGKTELYRYIQAQGGQILVNPSDQLQVTHGGEGAFSFAEELQAWVEEDGFVHIGDGRHKVKTNLSGSYQGDNLKAAWTLGLQFGMKPENICSGLQSYIPTNNRGEIRRTENNIVFLDAYNANPSSMEASFRYATTSHVDRPHHYIAGDLFELGAYSEEEHQRMVDLFVAEGVENVWLVGEAFEKTKHPNTFKSFKTTDEALAALHEAGLTNCYVWVKGSRGMALERLLPAL